MCCWTKAREAGVGKSTLYLHWKDKTALFRSAIWHASKQAGDRRHDGKSYGRTRGIADLSFQVDEGEAALPEGDAVEMLTSKR